jgi:hypothetical protein
MAREKGSAAAMARWHERRKGKGARPGGPAWPAGPLKAKMKDGCWAVWVES